MNKATIFLLSFITFTIAIMSCNYENEYSEYKIENLNQSITDTLKVQTEERINNVEIKITGRIIGRSSLKIENGAGRYNKLILEGVINEIYETEWYEPNLVFIYEPLTEVKGDSLILKYRIY